MWASYPMRALAVWMCARISEGVGMYTTCVSQYMYNVDWPANTVAGCVRRISTGVKQSRVGYFMTWEGFECGEKKYIWGLAYGGHIYITYDSS